MGFGKVLAIISGILTLVATFALAWVDQGSTYVYGIGAAMNIPSAIGNISVWTGYLYLALEILLLLSFIFEFIGAKARFLAFLGGFIPFVIGVFLILEALLSVGFITTAVSDFIGIAGSADALVDGIIPFSLVFADMTLGAVILALSGLLGVISSFMKREDL